MKHELEEGHEKEKRKVQKVSNKTDKRNKKNMELQERMKKSFITFGFFGMKQSMIPRKNRKKPEWGRDTKKNGQTICFFKNEGRHQSVKEGEGSRTGGSCRLHSLPTKTPCSNSRKKGNKGEKKKKKNNKPLDLNTTKRRRKGSNWKVLGGCRGKKNVYHTRDSPGIGLRLKRGEFSQKKKERVNLVSIMSLGSGWG